MRAEIAKKIEIAKLVAIIRLADTSKLETIIRTLVESGISVLEITSNTPNYCEEIEKARRLFPESLVGAGTVLNVAIAKNAINAGAQFLVTPNVNVEVISEAHAADIPILVGAMTPTEIAFALEQGADFVKLFPAGSLGVNYLKELLGPFGNEKFFVVGGINDTNAEEWIEAGAFGLGIGGGFTKGNRNDISLFAKKMIHLINKI